MLMNEVFDRLSNCLIDGYSSLRRMRGADPEGYNYAMLENSFNDAEKSYMFCLTENFNQTLLQHIELQSREKGQQPFSVFFLNKLMNTYMEESFAKPRYFFDMDGVLFKFDNTLTSLEPLYEEGYFRELPTHRLAVQCMQHMLDQDPEHVYVLTHYIDSPFAYNEKKEVLQELFPALDIHNIILVPYGKNKVDYVPIAVKENDYLIDDYNLNLEQWKDAGGSPIKFVNDINDRHGTWKGNRIEYDDPTLDESLRFILKNNLDGDQLDSILNSYLQEKLEVLQPYANLEF